METGRCLTVWVIQFQICLHYLKMCMHYHKNLKIQSQVCVHYQNKSFRKIVGQLAHLRNSWQRGVNASLEGELNWLHGPPTATWKPEWWVSELLTLRSSLNSRPWRSLLTLGTKAVRLRRQQDLRDTHSFINNRTFCLARRRGCDKKE